MGQFSVKISCPEGQFSVEINTQVRLSRRHPSMHAHYWLLRDLFPRVEKLPVYRTEMRPC